MSFARRLARERVETRRRRGGGGGAAVGGRRSRALRLGDDGARVVGE